MRLFRIARGRHIHDLSGEGARLYGGRWNRKGTPLLYTSESRSLATVEFLVHLPLNLLPSDLFIAELELFDDPTPGQLFANELPVGWDSFPAMPRLAEIAVERMTREQLVALRVPSIVVAKEWNIILNPLHRHYQRLTIVAVEPYHIDRRLLRQNDYNNSAKS